MRFQCSALPLFAVVGGLTASVALGLPYEEKSARFPQIVPHSVNVYVDHENPNIIYVPFDVLALAKNADTGLPAFAFTYNERGGRLSFSVRAEYSPQRTEMNNKLRAEGYRVASMPIISGGYLLSISSKNRDMIAGVAANDVSTVDPTKVAAFDVEIDPSQVAYIAFGLGSGASVAVRYSYTFRAARYPDQYHATMNFSQFVSNLQNEDIRQSLRCHEGQNTAGNSAAFARACGSDFSSIRSIVQRAISRQEIRISRTVDENSKEFAIITDDITKMVLNRVFKPVQSLWRPVEANFPVPECRTSGQGAYDARCFAASSLYVRNEGSVYQNEEVTIDMTSQGIVNLADQISFNLYSLCTKHPNLFTYIPPMGGRIVHGCPTEWTGEGLKTPENGGKPVPPPTNGPAVPDPVVGPPVQNPFG